MSLLYIILLIPLSVSYSFQEIPLQNFKKLNLNKNISTENEPKHDKTPILNIQLPVKNGNAKQKKVSKNNQNESASLEIENKNDSHVNAIEPGADLRLVSVISVIVLSCLLFICCKIYRWVFHI